MYLFVLIINQNVLTKTFQSLIVWVFPTSSSESSTISAVTLQDCSSVGLCKQTHQRVKSQGKRKQKEKKERRNNNNDMAKGSKQVNETGRAWTVKSGDI